MTRTGTEPGQTRISPAMNKKISTPLMSEGDWRASSAKIAR